MASTEQQIDDAVAKRHVQNTDTALGVQSSNLDMNQHKIIGLEDPTGDKDAANKEYVDDHAGGNVVGPSSAIDSAIPLFDGTTGLLIKDSARLIEDVLSDGSNLPDGHAVKIYGDANWASGGGDVVGPGSHAADYVPQWNGTPNSKILVEGFAITAAGKALLDDANIAAQRTTLELLSAALRNAEDSLTDGSNLPDGAAIKAYGDANWGSGYTNLTQFVNQTAWRLFYSNNLGDVVELGLGTSGQYLKATGASSAPVWDTPGGGSGSPGGLNTYIQFNDSGVFGGDVDFTWTKAINQLDLANAQIKSLDSANSDFTLDTTPLSGGWTGWTYRGANSIKVRQAQVLPTNGSSHYFIDGLQVEHLDLDTTDYETSTTDHEMHGINVDMTGSCELNQYKGQIGISVRVKSRTGWAGRGVAALTNETFQYGVGIASNEFHVYNPAVAEAGIDQSTSMAGLQIVMFPHMGDEDASHIYRGLKIDNFGKRLTYGIQLHSQTDTYGSGHIKTAIGMGDAKITHSAIIMPQSVSGHVGTDIVYDTNDCTFYDRSLNKYGFSIASAVVAYISASGIDACTHKVINVVDPVNAQDVATKAYGDANWGGGSGYTNLTQFISQTAWRLFYSNGSGDVTELAFGTSGQYLKSTGVSSAPIWDTPSGGSGSPGGTNECIQYNSSGSFGGDTDFKWTPASNILNLVNAEIQSLDSANANFTLDSSPLLGAWTGWTYRGANVIKVRQAQVLPTNGSSHYFIDGFQINHYDGDTTNYESSSTQHEMHGVNIDMTGLVSSVQYKDMIGLSVRTIGRIGWDARGVAAITCETKQFGTGIAANEFHVFNPANAEGGHEQSKSMAGLQIVMKPHKGDEDSSHVYSGLIVDNFGKRITRGISLSSYGDGYGNGDMKHAISMGSAAITAAAIVMPASRSGHAGTIIEYASNDYTYYDRGANTFQFVISGNVKLSIDSTRLYVTGGGIETNTYGYAFKGKDSGGNMLNLAYAGTVGYCMIGAYCNYTNIGSGSSQPNPVMIRVNGVNGKQIFVGATDSGGSGYRMLRVTN